MTKLSKAQMLLIEQMKIYTAEKNHTFSWYVWRNMHGYIRTSTMNSLIRQGYATVSEDGIVKLTDKAQNI